MEVVRAGIASFFCVASSAEIKQRNERPIPKLFQGRTFSTDAHEHRHRMSRLPMTFTRSSKLYRLIWNGYTNLENQLSTRSNRE
jgi:hypothetical protein